MAEGRLQVQRVLLIRDDGGIGVAGQRENDLAAQQPGFGKEVRCSQIMKGDDDGQQTGPTDQRMDATSQRQQVDGRVHVKSRRLKLHVDHLQAKPLRLAT